jgi:hypothetical protein
VTLAISDDDPSGTLLSKNVAMTPGEATMMSDNDPLTRAMITYHQESLLEEASRSRRAGTPSPLRVAIGLMLIRMGEQIRGCTESTTGESTLPVPASRLRAAHQS